MKKLVNFFEENYFIFLFWAFFGWVYEECWYLFVEHKVVNRGFLYGPFLPVYGFGILVLLIFLRKILREKHIFGSVWTIPVFVFILNFIYISFIEYTHERIYRLDLFMRQFGLLELMLSVILVVLLLFMIGKKVKINLDLTPVIVFITIFVIATVVEFIAHYVLDTYFGIMLWDYSKDFINFNKRICFDASRNFAILGTLAIYFIQPFIDKLWKKMSVNVRHVVTCLFLIPMLIDFVLSILK